MKRVLLLSLVSCLFLFAKAQKVYFVYLQSENANPFYVRIGDKVTSSSAEGYLIIPRLKDSTYAFSLGQPGKRNEAQFSITINKNDRGFLIRESEGSLSLFDLQTLVLYKPVAPASTSMQTTRRDDSFTALLAKAADDSSLLYHAVMIPQQKSLTAKRETPVVVKEAVTSKPNPDTVIAVTAKTPDPVLESLADTTTAVSRKDIITDTSAATAKVEKKDTLITAAVSHSSLIPDTANKKTIDTVALAQVPVPVIEANTEYKKSTVIKKSESSLSSGFSLVFLDSYEGGLDTISLTIPNPAVFFTEATEKVAEDKKFLNISGAADSVQKDASVQNATVITNKKKPACANWASDDDFFKLRRDMAAEKEEDDMIARAKRYFRNKCYRTEQIKYLSTLFMTDAGKYHFFDTAYLHVYDQEKFETLQAEFKDPYYTNRFKALIAN